MKKLAGLALLVAIGLSAPLHAEKVEHFKGKPSTTLEEAVQNFSEYNQKLAKLVEGDLTPENMAEVHELTYTLERALAKINEEYKALGDTLEAVHVASETADRETVKQKGQEYLSVASKVIK